jgi:hypothetical protein
VAAILVNDAQANHLFVKFIHHQADGATRPRNFDHAGHVGRASEAVKLSALCQGFGKLGGGFNWHWAEIGHFVSPLLMTLCGK